MQPNRRGGTIEIFAIQLWPVVWSTSSKPCPDQQPSSIEPVSLDVEALAAKPGSRNQFPQMLRDNGAKPWSDEKASARVLSFPDQVRYGTR